MRRLSFSKIALAAALLALGIFLFAFFAKNENRDYMPLSSYATS